MNYYFLFLHFLAITFTFGDEPYFVQDGSNGIEVSLPVVIAKNCTHMTITSHIRLHGSTDYVGYFYTLKNETYPLFFLAQVNTNTSLLETEYNEAVGGVGGSSNFTPAAINETFHVNATIIIPEIIGKFSFSVATNYVFDADEEYGKTICRTKDDRVSGCDDSCFCDTHVVKRCWPGSAIDGICADSKTFSGSRGKLEFEGKCPTEKISVAEITAFTVVIALNISVMTYLVVYHCKKRKKKERKFEVLEDATNLIKLDEIPLQEKK